MFSTRTIAVIGVLLMATATAASAQGKRHAKEAEDEDEDTDADKARAKKAKAKAKAKDADEDEDAEAEKERARKAKAAKAKAKEAEEEAEKDKEKAKEKAKETEAEATSGGSSGGGPDDVAFHDGTLGFSIPFTVIGGAIGAAVGEPVPTVDVVYFLDDKSALDLIVGLNFHRKPGAAAIPPATTAAGDTNLLGIAAGLGYRLYSVKNSLRSYLEPQAVISWPDTSTTSALSVNLGASMGLERNLTPWLSISGALGATLNFANSFKDIQLATTAKLAANLYWH
jgi:hypothetical protein